VEEACELPQNLTNILHILMSEERGGEEDETEAMISALVYMCTIE